MSNSSLVTHVKLSPHMNSPRNSEIDTLTFHHVAGNMTVEALGELFSRPTRNASSTYGIGTDGRIAMYCEEKNRPWTTGSPANDHRAITIEISNSTGAPNWEISDAALKSAIDLGVDICKRNPKIPKLLWRNDKSLIGQVDKQNMTIHEWFQNTNCPGPYVKSKLGYIADEVNRRLGGNVMKDGDKVTIKQSATTYTTGETIPARIKGVVYTIGQMGDADNKRIGSALIQEITSWVRLTDLEPVVVTPPATVLKSEYDKIIADLKSANAKYEATHNNLSKALASVSTLQGDLINMENEMQQLIEVEKKKVEALNKKAAEFETEYRDSQFSLEELQDNYTELANSHAELVKEKLSLEEIIANLKVKNGIAMDKLAEGVAEINLLNIRIVELEKEIVLTPTEPPVIIDWKDASAMDLIIHAIKKMFGKE